MTTHTTSPTLFPVEPTTDNKQPQPVVTGPSSVVVKIIWPINYNSKMSCDGFIHLDVAPDKMPKYSAMETTVIEISTADESHPPINCRLIDILKIDYNKINTILTLASHGLELQEFETFIFEKYGYERLARKTIAVYYYKKC